MKPSTHQNVEANAAARTTGSRPAAPPPASCRWPTTASTAPPNAPPSCWKIRIALVARGIAGAGRPRYGLASTGTMVAPRPTPLTSSAAPSNH
ncbi:hypothetical protein [Micromonospora purpureochromogenes]|uniref:Uncharacterized protein n=1 Tax=Micromonospora purpureochromogenes TaxID=47872 RepID=A0ABX2RR28_9ACTN|nr:hypothetical protein [Micromonospora purpureochromogenes]NYF58987.1 hypothetical protein [Micromonospora purpureochromogenes]